MKKLVGSILLVVAVVGIVGAGVATLVVTTATPAEAARCICPLVYAPVVCDNGRTYPNQCVADCRHAKNCVPTGTL
jgi:hypothetical protein